MNTAPDKEVLLVEYAAANSAYMHYDNFSWQVGAILIAGVFVSWGFIVGESLPVKALILISTGTTLLMSLWLLYCNHNRQIYLCKLHRIHQIEELLGMEQHIGWVSRNGAKPKYRSFGVPGHILNERIFLLASLGTISIAISSSSFDLLFVLPATISIFATVYTRWNDRRLKNHLRSLSAKPNTIVASK